MDFVRRWSEKTEIGAGRFVQWLGVTGSKFYDWRQRYGCVNAKVGLPGRRRQPKSKSPPCRKERGKDGAPAGAIVANTPGRLTISTSSLFIQP